MGEDESESWICTVCGYVYDPALHDGVEFAQLPADWLCPGCGFGTGVFVPRHNTPEITAEGSDR